MKRPRSPSLFSLLVLCSLSTSHARACHSDESQTPVPPAAILNSDRQSPTAAAPPSESHTTPATSASAALPTPRKREKLVLIAGGDVNLGRGMGQRILRKPEYDPFAKIAPLLSGADLLFANLESPLSKQRNNETMRPDNPKVFTGPLGGADVMKRAGFDIVATANNHVWDYQKRGFLSTMDQLDRVGVLYAGTSREPGESYRPTRLEINGWKIAVFAVTHIWNQGPIQKHRGRDFVAWAAFQKIGPEIERARKDSDLVLLSYHGGGEYINTPMTWTRTFVEHVMEAGVDAVLGHHPHVPHGVGWFDRRPVFYSLGNFVFLPNEHRWTATSFVARVTFHPDGPSKVEACPFNLMNLEPTPFSGKHRDLHLQSFGSHLRRISRGFGGTIVGTADQDGCMELAPKPPSPKKEKTSPSR